MVIRLVEAPTSLPPCAETLVSIGLILALRVSQIKTGRAGTGQENGLSRKYLYYANTKC